MAKPKIFISYDYDNDKHYKNLLVAWDKNSEFDFSFYDESVDVSVDSTDAAAIKRVISARIGGATHFLCLVGKKTHSSHWVAWEIEKAKELKKKLVAVKIDRENTSPSGLIGAGVSWAMSFTFDSIKKAVEGA
ncbi:MAG: TIR domain-containing protein [candidate division NC10 bacterium]|nr:TIR domain-containing protein [candidate division NC10 bacterium]